jgi:outer membrane protease
MRNIVGFFILVSISFSLQQLHGEENPGKWAYAFSISPTAGILWGRAEEILYKDPDSDTRISQLLWDLKPLVYAGTDFEFGPRNLWTKSGFTAGLSLKYGFPLKTGIMEDRDWLSDDAYITNYSNHDAYANGVYMVDISTGFSWAFASRISLRVYGEFSYMYLSWTSQDGYIQYPKDGNGNYLYDGSKPWDPDLPKDPVYGTGIIYTQNWLMFSPSLSFALKLTRYFSLEMFTAWTPFIYAVCIDDHLMSLSNVDRYTRGQDYLTGGSSLKEGIKFIFSPTEGFELGLSISCRFIDGPRGDSYERKMGINTGGDAFLSVYQGGAGLMALDAGFLLKVTL